MKNDALLVYFSNPKSFGEIYKEFDFEKSWTTTFAVWQESYWENLNETSEPVQLKTPFILVLDSDLIDAKAVGQRVEFIKNCAGLSGFTRYVIIHHTSPTVDTIDKKYIPALGGCSKRLARSTHGIENTSLYYLLSRYLKSDFDDIILPAKITWIDFVHRMENNCFPWSDRQTQIDSLIYKISSIGNSFHIVDSLPSELEILDDIRGNRTYNLVIKRYNDDDSLIHRWPLEYNKVPEFTNLASNSKTLRELEQYLRNLV